VFVIENVSRALNNSGIIIIIHPHRTANIDALYFNIYLACAISRQYGENQ